MRIYKRPTAVALGVFDGIHLGHKAVLKAVHDLYRNKGRMPGVCTFQSEKMSRHKSAPGYLYSSKLKEILLKDEEMQFVWMPSFEKIRHIDGRTFAQKILHEFYAKDVCCGRNFRFGENASCDVHDLEQFGKWFGFNVHVIEDIQKDNIIISSTEIRKLLLNGKIETANSFLGEPYQIRQEVTHGAQLGRTIGFPTVNQLFEEGQLVPKFGVYASETHLPDGRIFSSLTNIGLKPTVDYQGLPLAETYIKDFSGDLYHKIIIVKLLRFIRPEMKFASVEQLTEQMTKDLQS